jgi:hypothetical protein
MCARCTNIAYVMSDIDIGQNMTGWSLKRHEAVSASSNYTFIFWLFFTKYHVTPLVEAISVHLWSVCQSVPPFIIPYQSGHTCFLKLRYGSLVTGCSWAIRFSAILICTTAWFTYIMGSPIESYCSNWVRKIFVRGFGLLCSSAIFIRNKAWFTTRMNCSHIWWTV